MKDVHVLNGAQKEARSRFERLLDVLAGEKINTVPHIFISKIKAPPFGDAKDKNGEDLVRCFVIRARAPTGEYARKDKLEMAVHEAFVGIVKEEVLRLAHIRHTKLGRALSRRNFQKIRLQVVGVTKARLRTEDLVESDLLPLSE
jgi:hypothetical protein